jgi:hypothetical protein
MEASNIFKNAQIRDICRGSRVTGESWLTLSRKLEKRTLNRLGRIEETGKFKPVGKKKTRSR